MSFNPFASVSTNSIVNPVAIKEALTKQSNNSNSINQLNNEVMQENQVSPVNTVESNQTNQIHPTTTTEVITPNVTNTVAETVEVTETVKRVSSKEKYANLITLHTTWGEEKIAVLIGGKVKRNPEQSLLFLNWVNTVEVDGSCLEKNEVLFVIKNKLSADLGIESTVGAAEGLWNASNMNPWSKRLGVKKGYTKNKLVYEWD